MVIIIIITKTRLLAKFPIFPVHKNLTANSIIDQLRI